MTGMRPICDIWRVSVISGKLTVAVGPKVDGLKCG